MRKTYSILLLLLSAVIVHGQKLKKEDRQLMANLQHHIHILADDKLEGRRTGTEGEKMAAEYISSQFKAIGLQPKGTNGFYQSFEINEGKQVNKGTYLSIDGKQLDINKEFFPLSLSPASTLESNSSIALKEAGTIWFYDLKEWVEENTGNPHFDIMEAVRAKVLDFRKKGASALILYNSQGSEDGLSFNGKEKGDLFPIPVIYINRQAVKKYLNDESATMDIKLKTDITEKKRTATNIIGYIDNGAPLTVILGAHFDHLGHGEDENSLEINNKGKVHNGADDNASGTAALIELARMLKSSRIRNNNYLVIAFSGEELGLFGSKYFTEHPTIDLNKANYMINMDMVGRLNDSSHVVIVGGYGTSSTWGHIYNQSGKHKLYTGNLLFHFDSTGTGPSDHTSFYLKNIPVLFYFTGLHSDYHKTTDDFEKINFPGEMIVVKHIYSLIEEADRQKNKLAFLRTKDPPTTTSARFSVTLGIMPDYTFTGSGVRIDAVSENRPAMKAGLKAGDVITALGNYRVFSLEGYMQALGKFKKGDKTTVEYNRANQTFSSTIEF